MKTLLRVLTNSERTTFECRRRWFFRYLLGLTTLDARLPLRQGSLWHLCLAAWYRGVWMVQQGFTDRLPTAAEISIHVIEPWVEKREFFNRQRRDLTQDQLAEVLAADEASADMCFGMLEGYVSAWSEKDMTQWRVLYVEPQVARWALHPRTTRGARGIFDHVTFRCPKWDGRSGHDLLCPVCKGSRSTSRRRRWAYGGAIDVVLQRISDETNWIMEHKTTKETDMEEALKKYAWDPQTPGYAWALQAPLRTEVGSAPSVVEGPIKIHGIIYNLARKKVPREPELLKDKTRLSKQAIDTTRAVFMRTIDKHGFNPDDYADQLAALKNKVFFAREPVHFSERQISDAEREIGYAALEAIREGQQPYHLRQPSACHSRFGGVCEFAGNMCDQDVQLNRALFNVMGVRHAELTGDLAEPFAGTERALPPGQLHGSVIRTPAREADAAVFGTAQE